MSSTLAAEANHRIANSLATVSSLLRTASSALGKDGSVIPVTEARAVLGVASGRVDVIARLHKQLSSAGEAEEIDAGPFLCGIATDLVEALAEPGRFRLLCQIQQDCLVRSDQALKLGLIVGELVINAIKYSHPTGVRGRIWLTTARRGSDRLRIEVADDGVGMSAPAGQPQGVHQGGSLIRALCSQLGAEIHYQSHDLGLRCWIELPLPETLPSARLEAQLAT